MTVAAHGGDIYQNQITYDFSVNTNPLPLPEILQKRMAEAAVHSNRYPQYDNVLLRERLAALYGFSTEEVVCGNGASELFVAIVHALRPKRVGILAPSFRDMPGRLRQWEPRYAVFRCGKKIILPWIWHRWSHCAGIWMESAYYFWRIQRIRRETKWKRLFWRRFLTCEKKQITVVLDECFIAFTGTEGYVSWIRKYPHLIVVRAYTKIYAIPGIRLGYLLAQKDICEKNCASAAGVECICGCAADRHGYSE